MRRLRAAALPVLAVCVVSCSAGDPVTGSAVVSTYVAATATVTGPAVTVTSVSTAVTTDMITATKLANPVTVTTTPAPITITATATAAGQAGGSVNDIVIGGVTIAFPDGSKIQKKVSDTFTVVSLADYKGMVAQVAVHTDDRSSLTDATFLTSEKKWFGTDIKYARSKTALDPIGYEDVNGKNSSISLDKVFDVATTGQEYRAYYYDDTSEGLLVAFALVRDPAGGSFEFDVEVEATSDAAAKKALDYNFAQIGAQLSRALHQKTTG